MDDWRLDEIHAKYWNKLWFTMQSGKYYNENVVMGDWNSEEKSLSK